MSMTIPNICRKITKAPWLDLVGTDSTKSWMVVMEK